MTFSKHRGDPPKPKRTMHRNPVGAQLEAMVYAEDWRESHANAQNKELPKFVQMMEGVRAKNSATLLKRASKEQREAVRNSTTGGMGPKNPHRRKS